MKVISQTESRLLSKWVNKKYSLRVDGFYFWRMSVKDAAKTLSSKVGSAVTENDILVAIRFE